MSKYCKYGYAFSLLAAVSVFIAPRAVGREFASGQGRELRVDSVLASVNGESVTLLDVMLETGASELRLASMYTGERLYSETEKLRRATVDKIIVRKLVYAIYLEKPFEIDVQYVEGILDMLAETIGGGTREGLMRKAKSLGLSEKALREKAYEKIAVDILLMQNCDRSVYITPKRVFEYYEKNIREWTTPANFTLQLLLVSTGGSRAGIDPEAVAGKLKKELASADEKTFAASVRANSDAPNSEAGGYVGPIEEDKIRPEFAPLLKNAKPGSVFGPVKTLEGFYFIRLVSIVPGTRVPFEKASDKIYANLLGEAKLKAREKFGSELKSKAVVKYYY